MADSSYTTKGLEPPLAVSTTTIPMAGLLVDVYGLEEMRARCKGDDEPVTCLWLLHPRTRTRARMHDVARRMVHAWNRHLDEQQQRQQQQQQQHKQMARHRQRGLIALAFDMPNHGSRLISEPANQTWRDGNARHAIDMAGIVQAARRDMSGLMDLAGAYLDCEVDAHVALGWSLGGHAAWQACFGEARLDAAVVVVGCPDFLDLMTHRAKNAGLDADGSPLLGGQYFPPALVAACAAHDPRGIMFGADTTPVPTPPLPATEHTRLTTILDARGLRGKRILVCSGADDALVPHVRSEPLLAVLRDAAQSWYRHGDLVVDDRVYPGVGHRFSADMVKDAVAFVVAAVDEGPRGGQDGTRPA